MSARATGDPETSARLTEHRLEPPLDTVDEPGDETPRGTFGRGSLSVEVQAKDPALDDSPNHIPPRSSLMPLARLTALAAAATLPLFARGARGNQISALRRNESRPTPVVDTAMPITATPAPTANELSSSRELLSDPSTMVAIGGTAAMSLDAFGQTRQHSVEGPSPTSMRVMETGLALVAMAVALLLNLGR
jgi:hypothetical protein